MTAISPTHPRLLQSISLLTKLSVHYPLPYDVVLNCQDKPAAFTVHHGFGLYAVTAHAQLRLDDRYLISVVQKLIFRLGKLSNGDSDFSTSFRDSLAFRLQVGACFICVLNLLRSRRGVRGWHGTQGIFGMTRGAYAPPLQHICSTAFNHQILKRTPSSVESTSRNDLAKRMIEIVSQMTCIFFKSDINPQSTISTRDALSHSSTVEWTLLGPFFMLLRKLSVRPILVSTDRQMVIKES